VETIKGLVNAEKECATFPTKTKIEIKLTPKYEKRFDLNL
jgi:hypothetical protein